MDKFGRNTLIVYYTRTGRCARVAEYLRDLLHADLDEVRDTHDYTGKKGLALCCIKALLRRNTEIGRTKYDPAFYDDVIFVTPIWADERPAIRTYVQMHADRLGRVSIVACAGLNNKKDVESEFREDFGIEPYSTLGLTTDTVDCGIFTAYARRFSGVAAPAHDANKENFMNKSNENKANETKNTKAARGNSATQSKATKTNAKAENANPSSVKTSRAKSNAKTSNAKSESGAKQCRNCK